MRCASVCIVWVVCTYLRSGWQKRSRDQTVWRIVIKFCMRLEIEKTNYDTRGFHKFEGRGKRGKLSSPLSQPQWEIRAPWPVGTVFIAWSYSLNFMGDGRPWAEVQSLVLSFGAWVAPKWEICVYRPLYDNRMINVYTNADKLGPYWGPIMPLFMSATLVRVHFNGIHKGETIACFDHHIVTKFSRIWLVERICFTNICLLGHAFSTHLSGAKFG